MVGRHVLYLSMAMMFGILSLFQSSPYMVWAMFELNLFMILPFLLNRSEFCHPTKGAVIYFGCQSIASVYMIGGMILQDLGWSGGVFVLLLGFFCKLGVFPFYSWVPRTMVSLSWLSCLVLLTFQKVFPIFCVPEVWVSSMVEFWFMVVLGISGVLAGGMMFFQTHLKAGLGYSSVLNMSWVLSLKMVGGSESLVATFLFFYIPVVLSVIVLFMVARVYTLADVALFQWGRYRWVTYLAVLSLGGVPGLMGFLPKLIVVSEMISHCWLLMVALLVSSAFSILWYTAPVVMAGVSLPAYSEGSNKSVWAVSYLSLFFNLLGLLVLVMWCLTSVF
uniref:NADH-ubiquinone oxidoreductase chain 2 n=1 Tax=Atrina pectinata TaxID=49198 RepID=L0ET29_ATRPE|nr:NADH dehydrogenase subunit 2 [Atrina pectinata]AGA63954.1 NADH dehydrogenase subunit 2 [Atrina pectinata]